MLWGLLSVIRGAAYLVRTPAIPNGHLEGQLYTPRTLPDTITQLTRWASVLHSPHWAVTRYPSGTGAIAVTGSRYGVTVRIWDGLTCADLADAAHLDGTPVTTTAAAA